MHNGIESTLQKRRVDCAEWFEAFGRQAGGEEYSMLLGNANIEISIGMVWPEAVQPGAIGHSRGNRHDFVVHVGKLHQRVRKNLGISTLDDRLGLPGFRIIRPQAMELFLLLQSRLKALPFLGKHMQQHRTVLRPEEFESLDQRRNVVSINGPEV